MHVASYSRYMDMVSSLALARYTRFVVGGYWRMRYVCGLGIAAGPKGLS